MITIYGTDWCEDTRRARRHLRRLSVPHRYRNIDDDLDALDHSRSLNGGQRRTPMIDLGVGGDTLVEPDNDTLTGALVEMEMLTQEQAQERIGVQNVGDFERVARTLSGVVLLVAASSVPRPLRIPFGLAGAIFALSGATGWCPVYQYSGVTSLGGPGDRPDEATRDEWLARNPTDVPMPRPREEAV
jgi:glutaredoxin